MQIEQLKWLAEVRTQAGLQWIVENYGRHILPSLVGAQMLDTEDCILCRCTGIKDFNRVKEYLGLTSKQLQEMGFAYGEVFLSGTEVKEVIAMYQEVWDTVLKSVAEA